MQEQTLIVGGVADALADTRQDLRTAIEQMQAMQKEIADLKAALAEKQASNDK